MADVLQLTGPLGGALAGAFGAGCVAGWGFAMRLMTGRIADLKEDCEKRDLENAKRIHALEEKVDRLDGFLLHGMERQLAQVRLSADRVIGPGEAM